MITLSQEELFSLLATVGSGVRESMYILGTGVAIPEVELTNETLSSFGCSLSDSDSELVRRFGVTARRVTLPLDFISQASEVAPLAAREVSLCSPSALGAQAAQRALEEAGITLDQVGLLIAESGTPHQTCPSEAQRIGGALGGKFPAYDVVGGIGAFCLYFEMLSAWRDERLPEFVLVVSTNTPSHHIAYTRSAVPAHLFGDGAAAFVLSRRKQGKYRIVESLVHREHTPRSIVSVDQGISLRYELLKTRDELAQVITPLFKEAIHRNNVHLDSVRFTGPQILAGDTVQLAQSLGIEPDRVHTASHRAGFALGTSLGSSISEACRSSRSGDYVVAVHGGDGLFNGSLLIAVE